MDYLKRIWTASGVLERKDYLKPISIIYSVIWGSFILYGTFELLTYLLFNIPHIFDSYTRSFIFWRLKNDLPMIIFLIAGLLLNIRFYPFVQDYLMVRVFKKADFKKSMTQFKENFKEAYNQPARVTKKTYSRTGNKKNFFGDDVQARNRNGIKKYDIEGKPIYEQETTFHEVYETESKLEKAFSNEKNERLIESGIIYVFKRLAGILFFLFAWNISFIMGWFIIGKYID
ncbi:hypothetical protein [Vagococcus hydrophili]|uniref:Uncharacterized protein n=1 Tax=Vagococcus hydrophili TaxID=2714947 RepID=A0A6G8ASX1_9ENTE|nr:hypothetical protein [Vagococcus hydrophili]QIL48069.1 hypothetical protein G7082_05865 [Vagococcus hydrophili]